MKTARLAVVKMALSAIVVGVIFQTDASAALYFNRLVYECGSEAQLRVLLQVMEGKEKLLIEETTEILASRRSGQMAQFRQLMLEGDSAVRVRAKLSQIILSREIANTPPEEVSEIFLGGGSFLQVSLGGDDREVNLISALPAEDSQVDELGSALENAIRDALAENEQSLVVQREFTESDEVPARAISIEEVNANPESFVGKRVELTGFMVIRHEGDAIYASIADARKGRRDRSVWVEMPKDEDIARKLNEASGRRVKLTGVFTMLNRGHFSLWRGALVRLTDVFPVEHPQHQGG